jgi:hypothetical protein
MSFCIEKKTPRQEQQTHSTKKTTKHQEKQKKKAKKQNYKFFLDQYITWLIKSISHSLYYGKRKNTTSFVS